jgi:hypothetical protein
MENVAVQQKNEAMVCEEHEDGITSTVDVKYLCSGTVALPYSILSSNVVKTFPDHCLMSCPQKQLDIKFVNNIEVESENERHMCYVISVVQIFYHTEDLRKLLVKMTEPEHSVFRLRKLCLYMGSRQRYWTYQLRHIQTALDMRPNDNAFEAIGEIIGRTHALPICQSHMTDSRASVFERNLSGRPEFGECHKPK